MKLLISDFLFVNAHKSMNLDLIMSFASFASIDLISLNGYYDDEKEGLISSGINVIDISLDRSKKGPIRSRLFSAKVMHLIGNQAKLEKYDMVVTLAYDTLALAAGLKYFKGQKLAVFNHKNIDELTNSVKRLVFSFYMNEIYHFVFEDFFRTYLISEINIAEERVFLVSHPIKSVNINNVDIKYDCVGMCNSNSEQFIDDVILMNDELAKAGKTVLLRSKNRKVSLSNVEIISGYLNYDEYDSLIQSGRTILVPLPDNYIYRLSGSIYDAIAHEKIVYTSSEFYVNDYGKRYPGICKRVSSAKELLKQLCDTSTPNYDSFKRFKDDHALGKVGTILEYCSRQIVG